MPRKINSDATRSLALYLGRTICFMRKRKGLKAESLAHDVGVTQQSISQIETGKAVVSLAVLGEIARVLDVPIWRLLRSAENAREMNATMLAERERRAARDKKEDTTP